jgi:hypothetical protein
MANPPVRISAECRAPAEAFGAPTNLCRGQLHWLKRITNTCICRVQNFPGYALGLRQARPVTPKASFLAGAHAAKFPTTSRSVTPRERSFRRASGDWARSDDSPACGHLVALALRSNLWNVSVIVGGEPQLGAEQRSSTQAREGGEAERGDVRCGALGMGTDAVGRSLGRA